MIKFLAVLKNRQKTPEHYFLTRAVHARNYILIDSVHHNSRVS